MTLALTAAVFGENPALILPESGFQAFLCMTGNKPPAFCERLKLR